MLKMVYLDWWWWTCSMYLRVWLFMAGSLRGLDGPDVGFSLFYPQNLQLVLTGSLDGGHSFLLHLYPRHAG
jgi:hypothetical protein